MNRKLKTLGLALVAAMAFSAFAAVGAQAEFHSSDDHTIISGSQTTSHVFKATGGFAGISCSTASFLGTSTEKTEDSQTITPTYSGCKDTLGRTVDIDNEGLTYEFTTDHTVHVTGGIKMTITNGSGSVVCTVTVGAQTNTGITYNNLGGTNGVEVDTNSADVQNTTSGGFLNCGVTNGAHTGTYEGKTVVTGEGTDEEPAEISVTTET